MKRSNLKKNNYISSLSYDKNKNYNYKKKYMLKQINKTGNHWSCCILEKKLIISRRIGKKIFHYRKKLYRRFSFLNRSKKIVITSGIEPETFGLKDRCSTA